MVDATTDAYCRDCKKKVPTTLFMNQSSDEEQDVYLLASTTGGVTLDPWLPICRECAPKWGAGGWKTLWAGSPIEPRGVHRVVAYWGHRFAFFDAEGRNIVERMDLTETNVEHLTPTRQAMVVQAYEAQIEEIEMRIRPLASRRDDLLRRLQFARDAQAHG